MRRCGIFRRNRTLHRLPLYSLLAVALTACGWVDDGVDGNTPPDASAGEYSVEEGGTLSVSVDEGVLANDRDPGGQPLTAKLAEGPAHAERFELQSDGAFLYQHDGSEESVDRFSYVANDGVDDSDPVSVEIRIVPVNDAPVIVGVEALTLIAGEAFVLDVGRFEVEDPDNAFPDDFVVVIEEGENYAVSGTTITPRAGYSGTLTLELRITDGLALSEPYRLDVSVESLNRPPGVVQPIGDRTAQVGVALAMDLAPHFSDPDGEPLRFAATGLPTSLHLDPQRGTLAGTPAPEEGGSSYTVVVTVTDPSAAQASDSFRLQVLPAVANRAPEAHGGCLYVAQEEGVSATLTASDPDGDPLQFRLASSPSKGSVTLLDAALGTFHYTPAEVGAPGRDSFRFEVTDPAGASASAEQVIIIRPRVMPLGDSITTGAGALDLPDDRKISYRKRLYEELKATGYEVDFVGSQRLGAALFEDPDNEGHGGWTDGAVADAVYGWLEQNPADAVLLHIGSNGLDPSPADVERILNEIDRWESDAARANPITVLLARIIDQYPSHPDVTRFNDAVEEMARARMDAGDRILIVDQQRALWSEAGEPDPRLYDDPIHPNQQGYDAMAAEWFEALRPLLDRCP